MAADTGAPPTENQALPIVNQRETWQFFAQRILDGTWLDRVGAQVSNATLTWDLQTDQLTFTITPQQFAQIASDGSPLYLEYSTAIYVVNNGLIRWGGLITDAEFTGPSWVITCTGFRGYANGNVYAGDAYTTTGADPLHIVRLIWSYLQGQPNGNLGLVPDSTQSPIAIGTVANPYILAWYNATDCGQEIMNLAQSTPFDMREVHYWADSGQNSVAHRLELGYPRLGTRQDKLRFVEGENIVAMLPVSRNGADYKNEMVGVGAGTGSAAVRAFVAQPDSSRLRRCGSVSDQTMTTTGQIAVAAQKALTAVQSKLSGEVQQLSWINHANAPLGSFKQGDDILIQIRTGWLKGQQIWHRIMSYTYSPDTRRGTMTLARSDSFVYGQYAAPALASTPLRGGFVDVTGDGKPDIVAVNTHNDLLYRYPGAGGLSGTSTFGSPTNVGSGWTPDFQLASVSDVYGSGSAGLVVQRFSTAQLLYYRNSGSGTFTSPPDLLGTGWTKGFAIVGSVKLYNEAKPGILAIDPSGYLRYYANAGGTGTGTYKSYTVVGNSWRARGWTLNCADFTGDSYPDLLAVRDDGNVYIYPNNPGHAFNLPSVLVAQGYAAFEFVGWAKLSGAAGNDLIYVDALGNMYCQPNLGGSLRVGFFGNPVLIGTGWTGYVIM